jgi:hypothetical protein
MKNKDKNNISVDGQTIEINKRKYVLIEIEDGITLPFLKIKCNLFSNLYGKEVKI